MVRLLLMIVMVLAFGTGCARSSRSVGASASTRPKAAVYPISPERADQIIYKVLSSEEGLQIQPLPEPSIGYAGHLQGGTDWSDLTVAVIPVIYDVKDSQEPGVAFEFSSRTSVPWRDKTRRIFDRVLEEASKVAAPVTLSAAQVVAGRRSAAALENMSDASRISRVRLGMMQDQLLQLLGEPASVREVDGMEYFSYELYASPEDRRQGISVVYEIGLRDGLVASLTQLEGEDAGPQETPQSDLNAGATNQIPQNNTHPGIPMLQRLKQEGKITDAQFQQMMRQLLERQRN